MIAVISAKWASPPVRLATMFHSACNSAAARRGPGRSADMRHCRGATALQFVHADGTQGSRDESGPGRSDCAANARIGAPRRGRVVDADGARVVALGDIERPVFPRSAVKVLQALPLVESGAADRLALERRGAGAGLRLAQRRAGAHAQPRPRMLAKAGLDDAALECGTHWPYHEASARALAAAGASRRRAAQQLLGQARRLPAAWRALLARRPRALRLYCRATCSPSIR